MSAADEALLGQFLILYPLLTFTVGLALFGLAKNYGSYVLRALRLIPLAVIDLSILSLNAARRTLS